MLTMQVSEDNLQQLQGVPRFHPTKQMVIDYIRYILENASEYMVTITAMDVTQSDISSNIQHLLEMF